MSGHPPSDFISRQECQRLHKTTTTVLKDIRIDVRDGRKENREEFSKLWDGIDAAKSAAEKANSKLAVLTVNVDDAKDDATEAKKAADDAKEAARAAGTAAALAPDKGAEKAADRAAKYVPFAYLGFALALIGFIYKVAQDI